MLSPDELLGIPNKRNRYYFVAKYRDDYGHGDTATRTISSGVPRGLSSSGSAAGVKAGSETESRLVSEKFIVSKDGNSKIYTDLPKSIKVIYHQCFSEEEGGNRVLTIGDLLQPLYQTKQTTDGSKDSGIHTTGREKYDSIPALQVPAAILSSSWA
jgi:hypothetical protein